MIYICASSHQHVDAAGVSVDCRQLYRRHPGHINRRRAHYVYRHVVWEQLRQCVLVTVLCSIVQWMLICMLECMAVVSCGHLSLLFRRRPVT